MPRQLTPAYRCLHPLTEDTLPDEDTDPIEYTDEWTSH